VEFRAWRRRIAKLLNAAMGPAVCSEAPVTTPTGVSAGPRHYTQYLPGQIPRFRKNRRKTEFAGCWMCEGIYIKADNKLPCSCLTGYHVELADISKQDVAEFVKGPIVDYIKSSFREGYEPFPICAWCACRISHEPETGLTLSLGGKQDNAGIDLYVEPINTCNLFCEACLCTEERKLEDPPPRALLGFPMFEKAARELHKAKIAVRMVVFAGFGEPLFNPRITDMSRLVRDLFPSSVIDLDTNANHAPQLARTIADCGLDVIRLGLDGPDQATYELYRQRGDFSKALRFAEELVKAIKETGCRTRPVWKYILFKHNDRDDQIVQAISIAEQMGLEIEFDYTVGPLASKRTEEDLRRVIADRKISANIDLMSYQV
jgi:wyosine [tRNA(Phe)-imidazoG37] synthetase (radical SAM superfamily)